MGGYASIPLVLGARLARVPSVIHESGAIPGKANLLAARITRHVALAWESAAPRFPASVRPRVVGMPLGPDLTGFDRDGLRAEAREAFGVPEGVTLVLVTGGSQGAASLNRLAVELAARWRDRADVRLLVKPGRRHAADVQRELEETGGTAVATAVAYFERMDHAYAAADLAVTRAGAGTIAELAVTGLPAVLVPYPYATDDHQAVNADVLVQTGGAVMIRDAEATADRVAPMIEKLLADPGELGRMSDAVRTAARPRAADDLAAWVLELAKEARR
jgi:UDP-N-acetylglucosamine--N-acetylmuramyl-(pentapeptide) pyrophosphoryl-undecaprenol N-acetylglucosamine transferase